MTYERLNFFGVIFCLSCANFTAPIYRQSRKKDQNRQTVYAICLYKYKSIIMDFNLFFTSSLSLPTRSHFCAQYSYWDLESTKSWVWSFTLPLSHFRYVWLPHSNAAFHLKFGACYWVSTWDKTIRNIRIVWVTDQGLACASAAGTGKPLTPWLRDSCSFVHCVHLVLFCPSS